MRLRTILPRPEIAPWIHHFWVFESGFGLPEADARVVVPNGRPKLIVPWRNSLVARDGDTMQESRTGEVVLIGVWDRPTILSSPREETVTIGVEFRPYGLSRFFDADLDELAGRIVPIDKAMGAVGNRLMARVNTADSLVEAVGAVQSFLSERLVASARQSDGLVDRAIALMEGHNHSLAVAELAQSLNVSRRHLQNAFRRQIGLTPKRMQSVLAFERLYRRFSQDKDAHLLRSEALDIWFDQAHFTRAFQQFTGFSPGRFADLENEFGRIFYKPA